MDRLPLATRERLGDHVKVFVIRQRGIRVLPGPGFGSQSVLLHGKAPCSPEKVHAFLLYGPRLQNSIPGMDCQIKVRKYDMLAHVWHGGDASAPQLKSGTW